MRTTNLEYVGWVDEIISVDYGKFEVVVLYCTWAQANKRGARATMKCDKYGFTLFRFDRLIPYSADSFAFPLYVQQVFLCRRQGEQWMEDRFTTIAAWRKSRVK
jgi:hypothetical protein